MRSAQKRTSKSHASALWSKSGSTLACATLYGTELKVLVEWLTRVLPDRTMILRDNSAKLLDGIFDTRL